MDTLITDIADVALALGVSTPARTDTDARRWTMWIGVAERDIDRRFDSIGGITALDEADVKYVVAEAVAAKHRDPVGQSQRSVSVDDGSVSATYTRSSGDVRISPEGWDRLTPPSAASSGTRVKTIQVTSTWNRLRR